jgi:hypothetical protein
MVVRRLAAMLATAVMIGACMPITGPVGPIGASMEMDGPSAYCPSPNLWVPMSDPALGGYDAQPGPQIGESQPILVSYPSYCYPR